MNGLIGYTGFVGSNILAAQDFEYLYNSKNIQDIHQNKMKLLVCAGAPGSMFYANKQKNKDKKNIDRLVDNILKARPDKIVLISTIGVFKNFNKVNNESSTDFEKTLGYGLNRRYLEQILQNQFSDLHILRLPSLFGNNLKKNFIFDIFNPAPSFFSTEKFYELKSKFRKSDISLLKFYHFNEKEQLYILDRHELNNSRDKILLENTLARYKSSSIFFHSQHSTHQFYNLNNLWKDICKVISLNIPVMHLATQPTKTKDIYKKLLLLDMPKTTVKAHHEKMETNYSKHWGQKIPFINSKKHLMSELTEFSIQNFYQQ